MGASSPKPSASDSAEPIDLILTDLVMPRMNGQELVARLEPLVPKAKVLYMSGYTPEAIVHRGLLTAEVEIIEKPFNLADLRKRVRAALDRGE